MRRVNEAESVSPKLPAWAASTPTSLASLHWADFPTGSLSVQWTPSAPRAACVSWSPESPWCQETVWCHQRGCITSTECLTLQTDGKEKHGIRVCGQLTSPDVTMAARQHYKGGERAVVHSDWRGAALWGQENCHHLSFLLKAKRERLNARSSTGNPCHPQTRAWLPCSLHSLFFIRPFLPTRRGKRHTK